MKIPDCYIIIKINVKENTDNIPTGTTYKLFSTWYGGYLGNDEWRINSGISNVQKEDNAYLIFGHSGTIYKVQKNVGYSNYTYSIIQEMTKNVPDYVSLKIINDVNEAIKVLESLIN